LLLTVKSGGRPVDAVAQTSKQGVLYLFNRVTGEPLFPIIERPYPASDVPGEVTSPTQPFPLAPEPFARQRLTADMLTQRTPQAHAWAVDQFKTFRSGGQFIPLSVDKQTVVFPGFDGGAEWGGSAADPRTGVIYVNATDIAWTAGLAEASAIDSGPGATLYQVQCGGCHGPDRGGFPPTFPSLIERSSKMSDEEILGTISSGKGRMPAFSFLANSPGLPALVAYVRTGKEPPKTERNDRKEVVSTDGPPARYRFTGFRKFLDPDGYPAVAPPWGTLNAIDLNTGKYLWKIPLGEYPELAAKGMTATGTENYGGPIVTAGGLVIIGATNFDSKLRAFDSRTGKLLWQADLPYAGNATPATYMVDGRQYVVIATSNARNPRGPQGSAYVAYALPDRKP
jgi:quinoprotein glucose dehydrogenase